MYAIDAHRVRDRGALVAAMRDLQFAALFTGAGGLACTQIPVVVEERNDGGLRLLGHVARANPHWRAVGDGIPALALFQGPHAYVSPGWYATKAETGKVVPTWAYVAVEAKGTLRRLEDPADLRAMLDRLTRRNEAGRPAPWAVSDAPADYLERMMRAIVGLVLEVETLDGVWKLNQAKSTADRAGTAAGLAGEPDPQARALARLVEIPPRN